MTMKPRHPFARLAVAAAVLMALVPVWPRLAPAAHAASCHVDSLSLHDPPINTDDGFDFQISINGADIQWLIINVPHTNVAISDATSSDWPTIGFSSSAATFAGATIADGGTTFVHLAAHVGDYFPPASWVVQASSDPSGGTPITCSGDASMNVVDTNPPVISGTSITVSSTSATINWQTDKVANSTVLYGSTIAYGNQVSDAAFVQAHSLQISNLSPSTVYHFQIITVDQFSNSATSDDSTFQTAAYVPPTVITNTVTNTVTNVVTRAGSVPGVNLKETPTESIPPTVSLATQIPASVRVAPKFTGTASDNDAVARIDYSTDGGRNWIPADHITTQGAAGRKPASLVSFSFTPALPEDGNYSVVVRATDTSGNTAATTPVALVIDRLAPQAGPVVLSYGPHTLQPEPGGVVRLVAGSTYQISTSAIGGPTSIALTATRRGQSAVSSTFALTFDSDTGLWHGAVSFNTGGTYQLAAQATDGAGNHTSTPLLTAAVMTPGHVVDGGTSKLLAGAKLTVRVRDPSTGAWQVWNGAPYGQSNPQTSAKDGSYSLMVPQGSYYLEATAPHRATYVTDVFTVARPTAVAATLTLRPAWRLVLGPLNLELPSLSWRTNPIGVNTSQAIAQSTSLPAQLPDFALPTTAGTTQTAIGLAGKPTVITILTTWSPDAQAQMPDLAAAQTDHDVNVVPLFSQQREAAVASYLATAGYSLTAVADPDGTLVPTLGGGVLPRHIFIDRVGHIKKVMVGVLSKEDILLRLGGL